MPVQKYVVKLSRVERTTLEKLIANEAPSARWVIRAKILLECDWGLSVAKIAYRVGVGHSTVERVRQRYDEAGFENALQEKPRLGIRPKLDGKQ